MKHTFYTLHTIISEVESELESTSYLPFTPILREKSNSAVLFTTSKKFKGLESRVIIIVDIDESCFSDEDKKRNFYVACSRATQKLALFVNANDDQIKAMGSAISKNKFAAKGKIAMKTQAKILDLHF